METLQSLFLFHTSNVSGNQNRAILLRQLSELSCKWGSTQHTWRLLPWQCIRNPWVCIVYPLRQLNLCKQWTANRIITLTVSSRTISKDSFYLIWNLWLKILQQDRLKISFAQCHNILNLTNFTTTVTWTNFKIV